jgi:hypothetical protein
MIDQPEETSSSGFALVLASFTHPIRLPSKKQFMHCNMRGWGCLFTGCLFIHNPLRLRTHFNSKRSRVKNLEKLLNFVCLSGRQCSPTGPIEYPVNLWLTFAQEMRGAFTEGLALRSSGKFWQYTGSVRSCFCICPSSFAYLHFCYLVAIVRGVDERCLNV